MSAQRGLADRKEYEAFCLSWYDAVLEETKRWCRKEEIQKLLAEAVMTDFRGQYADRAPPNNPEFNLRAQVCLIYSLTGENREKLESYLALHRFREKGESQPPVPEEGKTIKDDDDSQRPDPEQSVTEAEEKPAELVPDEEKQRDKASASEPEGTESSVREEKQVKNPAPPEARSTETNSVPSAQIMEPNNLQTDQREAAGQTRARRRRWIPLSTLSEPHCGRRTATEFTTGYRKWKSLMQKRKSDPLDFPFSIRYFSCSYWPLLAFLCMRPE